VKLVKDKRNRLRHYSTMALALAGSLQGAWAVFPEDLKAGLGPDAVSWVAKATAIILLLGLLGKFIDQSPKDAP
jgi:hypothetical protein